LTGFPGFPGAIAGRVVAFMAMSGSQWCPWGFSGGLENRPPVGHIGPSAVFRRAARCPASRYPARLAYEPIRLHQMVRSSQGML